MPRLNNRELAEGLEEYNQSRQEARQKKIEQAQKEALLKARAEQAKERKEEKKEERKQLVEKRKVEYAIALAQKYKDFVKGAYRKKLRKSVTRLLAFVPQELIKKLFDKTSAKDKAELASELISRVIFLPHSEFENFMIVNQYSTKRQTPAIHYRGHAFIDIKYADRQKVNESIIHEVVHMISGLAGKRFGDYNEVLSMALELFIEAEQNTQKKERALKIAKRVYRGKNDSNVYVRGINRGRKTFLMAEEIARNHGRGAVLYFFHNLFRSDVLSDYALESAAKTAKELHPPQK